VSRDKQVHDKLDIIIRLLKLIIKGEQIMSAEFDALTAQVAEQKTVEDSAIALINGLAAQIKALGDAPTPAQLSALTASLNASATSLASAVSANTPAAPPA
jgi:hypothetical protein